MKTIITNLNLYIMFVSFTIFTSISVKAKIKNELIVNLEQAITNYDAIEATKVLITISKNKINYKEWILIRNFLHSNSYVGWNVIQIWEKQNPKKLNKIDEEIKKADKLMLDKNFLQASIIYQDIIKLIQNKIKSQNYKITRNKLLLQTLKHSLGRSLYGAKLFNEALVVYESISSSYMFFKQVQFEKMWTAYKLKKYEVALGAIASQSSGFFSLFLEPESYLIQYYLFKQMCRTEELKIISKNISTFYNILKTNQYDLNNWLHKDIETLVYDQALRLHEQKNDPYYSKFKIYLNKRKEADEKRWIEQMEIVNAHIQLVNGDVKELEQITKLSNAKKILKNLNTEKWNAEDMEVWVDDLGNHIYIGENLCKK